jgi:hypothetical protein
MLITVTTSDQTLADILSSSEQETLEMFRNSSRLILVIQNLGTKDIYAEKGSAASVSDGLRIIKSGGTMELKIDSFEDLHLISDTSDNTNIRLFPV